MGTVERRRDVLPEDFRGSVHLQLPDVFHSLWDMGITFGIDRLVSGDASSTQSSGTPLVDPLASVRGSQRDGAQPGRGAGECLGSGAGAEARTEADAGIGGGAGAPLAGSVPGESAEQSSSLGEESSSLLPSSRPAALPQLLPRFGLEDRGSGDGDAAGGGSQASVGAGHGNISLSGDWKSTLTVSMEPAHETGAMQPTASGQSALGGVHPSATETRPEALVHAPVPAVAESPDRGSQNESSPRSSPGPTKAGPLPGPGMSLSLRLAAALDAIQEPPVDPKKAAGARAGRLGGPAQRAPAARAGPEAGGHLTGLAPSTAVPSVAGIAAGAAPEGAGVAARAAGTAGGVPGVAPDLPVLGRYRTALPGHRSMQSEGWEETKEGAFAPATLAKGGGQGEGEGQGDAAQGPGGEEGAKDSSLSLRLAAALSAFGQPPERKRRLALLLGPSRVTDVRKAMRTRQVPSHVPHGLVESPPHPPFAAGPAAGNMRKRLMLAAEAVQAGNYPLFEDMRCQLARFAKPRGVAMERIIHVMLQALEFRLKGGVTAHVNAVPAVTSMQMFAQAVVWYMTAHPGSLLTYKAVTAMIVPVLARKPRPHILICNPPSVAELTVIMRLLVELWHMHRTGAGGPDAAEAAIPFAQPGMGTSQSDFSSSHAQSSPSRGSREPAHHQHSPSLSAGHAGPDSPASTPGAPGGLQDGALRPEASQRPQGAGGAPVDRLRIRVTFMDLWPLVRPGRVDISSDGKLEYFRSMLMQAAAAMGADLDFSALRLTHDNLDAIEQIEVAPGETFVACLLHELKLLPSAPGKGGPLQRFIKKLVSLKPAMVAFQDESMECAGEDFVSCFGASMDYYWLYFDQNDACSGGKGRKWMNLVEPGFQTSTIYTLCAPESERMSMQYHSWAEWDRLWRLWGFQGKAVRGDLLEPMRRMLANFPPGFDAQVVGTSSNWLLLTWHNAPNICVSFWVPAGK